MVVSVGGRIGRGSEHRRHAARCNRPEVTIAKDRARLDPEDPSEDPTWRDRNKLRLARRDFLMTRETQRERERREGEREGRGEVRRGCAP